MLGTLLALAVLFGPGLLARENPMPFGNEGFWRIAVQTAAVSFLGVAGVQLVQGVVSIIIELVGGSVFLFVILRRGRL